MEVRKSDGTTEEFSSEKIKSGIMHVYEEVGEKYPEGLAEAIINMIDIYNQIESSEIRRQVEFKLMSFSKKAAKAYIQAFEKRDANDNIIRAQDDFVKNYIAATNAATGSKYDSNANVANKNIATLHAELPKQRNIYLNRHCVYEKLKSMYSKKIAQAYLDDLNNHIIYKHDESSLYPYCTAIQSYPFLTGGIRELGGLSAMPKNIDSFCGMYINMIFAVASQFAGAVATSGTFLMMDYYCRKEWGDDWHEHMDDRVAKIKYTDGVREEINVRRQIEQYFQQIVYSINQPSGARGFQSCFTNFAYFDKPYFDGLYGHFVYPDGIKPQWDSISALQKLFMEWLNNERTKCVLTFPVETMSILYKDGEFVDKEYADFTAEMYAKGHSFFTYISDSPDTLSSCCRLSNKIQENTFCMTNGLTGESTGSKSVITLNYNRIIQNFVREVYGGDRDCYKKDKDGFHQKFKEYLIPILERVYKYHNAYNDMLWDFYKANMLPVYTAGFISLNQQYLTLGLNGFNEGWMFLGGECRYNQEYIDFCKLICGTMKEQNALHRTKKTMFNSEFVPAESLGVKHYKWDKADGYWVPEGRNCYTSYFFLPDDENVDVLEKFMLHSREFVSSLDGGSACHVNLNEHLTKEQYKYLLEFAGKNGTNYFTFNVKNTECKDCGHISKHTLKKCPKCGSENLDYWTRIIGYLRRVSDFSEARQVEEGNRKYTSANV